MLVVASLWWWSGDDRLDDYAVYFYGAYGLGWLAVFGIGGVLVSLLSGVLAMVGLQGVMSIGATRHTPLHSCCNNYQHTQNKKDHISPHVVH